MPKVIVSKPRVDLRKLQFTLNQVLWGTDLSYAYFSDRAPKECTNPNVLADEVFKDVWTEAWYLNNQGRKKLVTSLNDLVPRFRSSGENRLHLYRSVLVAWLSYFESYLNKRLGEGKDCHWGPYVKTLKQDRLTKVDHSLNLDTVVRADVSREIRNLLVHNPLSAPNDRDGFYNFIRSRKLQGPITEWDDSDRDLTGALEGTIGNAFRSAERARKKRKDVPVDLFFMLFSFANIDALAFEIEEALIKKEDVPTKPSMESLENHKQLGCINWTKEVRAKYLIIES